MDFSPYLIKQNNSILDALISIEKNNKGFLIVVDNNDIVYGTLTDGDIRRSFISKHNVSDSIKNIYNRHFSFVYEGDHFHKIVSLFKNSKNTFLPIIDTKKKLKNIITRNQFHATLIEDIKFTLKYDFSSLNELVIDHEIHSRPWGFFKTTFLNPYARAKIINVFPQGTLSLQEHKKREEHWIVITGKGKVTIGESEKEILSGDYIFIPKGCKHRIVNTSLESNLMISEVQLGEYFGEDDIIRYEDKYGRV